MAEEGATKVRMTFNTAMPVPKKRALPMLVFVNSILQNRGLKTIVRDPNWDVSDIYPHGTLQLRKAST